MIAVLAVLGEKLVVDVDGQLEEVVIEHDLALLLQLPDDLRVRQGEEKSGGDVVHAGAGQAPGQAQGGLHVLLLVRGIGEHEEATHVEPSPHRGMDSPEQLLVREHLLHVLAGALGPGFRGVVQGAASGCGQQPGHFVVDDLGAGPGR